jgi:hypothetical protein
MAGGLRTTSVEHEVPGGIRSKDTDLGCERDGDRLLIRLGFPIFRKVQITIDLGGFETHRSGFKSKEMNPATLAPQILWLSAELLLD